MVEQTSRLLVVRHGETEWSRTGRHTGRTDVRLQPEGQRQADELREPLARLRPALVLTSPLRRAVETCERAGLGNRAEIDDDLVEWDYGDYEGRTTDEIRAEKPGWSLWTDGVPHGEGPADVGRRADRVIERARLVSGVTVVFAHGHLNRVLTARWVGLPPIGGRLWLLDPGSLNVLGWEREVPVIEGANRSPQELR